MFSTFRSEFISLGSVFKAKITYVQIFSGCFEVSNVLKHLFGWNNRRWCRLLTSEVATVGVDCPAQTRSLPGCLSRCVRIPSLVSVSWKTKIQVKKITMCLLKHRWNLCNSVSCNETFQYLSSHLACLVVGYPLYPLFWVTSTQI